jgi:hypothetical protein
MCLRHRTPDEFVVFGKTQINLSGKPWIQVDRLLLLLLASQFPNCKPPTINRMHGEGIEPPICPDTFQHRLEMSILSGFPGGCEILDCSG